MVSPFCLICRHAQLNLYASRIELKSDTVVHRVISLLLYISTFVYENLYSILKQVIIPYVRYTCQSCKIYREGISSLAVIKVKAEEAEKLLAGFAIHPAFDALQIFSKNN